MSIQSNVFLAVVILAILMVCPRIASAQVDIDNTHKKDPNSRIWEVYDIEGGGGHLEIGDKFRIKKAGADAVILPLAGLRIKWAKAKGFSLFAIQNVGPNPPQKVLCGDVKIPGHGGANHGEDHLIVVTPVSDDEIDIEFFVRDLAVPLKDQCKDPDIHGGFAHAEN